MSNYHNDRQICEKLCESQRFFLSYILFIFFHSIQSTVWKLVSVATGIKSKNFTKNTSMLGYRVPNERYEIQEYLDTR